LIKQAKQPTINQLKLKGIFMLQSWPIIIEGTVVQPLNSHNSRHWTLSFPQGLTEQEILQGIEPGKFFIEGFFKTVAGAIGANEYSILGFLLTKPILHAHVAFKATRKSMNHSQETRKHLESIWEERIGNEAKCSPMFNPQGWVEYIKTQNINAAGQQWSFIH
jgi:hypothetical protein